MIERLWLALSYWALLWHWARITWPRPDWLAFMRIDMQADPEWNVVDLDERRTP